MNHIKKYFVIGSSEWKVTVKWSMLLGVMLGVLMGTAYLLNVL